MAQLQDVVSSIRSKNAGPFTLTFDLFFPDADSYHDATDREVIDAALVARLYGLTPEQVRIFEFEPALAIKISIPRVVSGGDPADTDVSGGQQFVPLLGIEI